VEVVVLSVANADEEDEDVDDGCKILSAFPPVS
jgi:hypothetical protein